MRILALASYVPSRTKGAEIRLRYLLHHLSRDHEVTLWALNRRGIPEREIAQEVPNCRLHLVNPASFESPFRRTFKRFAWYRSGRELFLRLFHPLPVSVALVYQPRLKQQLRRLLDEGRFDAILVNQVMIGVYLPRERAIPTLLSNDNVWADLRRQDLARETKPLHRLLGRLEWRKTERYEKRIIERTDLCILVSEEDRSLVQRMVASKPLRVVPNGVDTAYFRTQENGAAHPGLVFTGTMSWEPNQDAMQYFASAIFPSILEQFPDATLAIVGQQPPPAILDLARHPQITVTGEVPDVRPYLAEAAVCVVPLRAGSGTRLKILEALSMGKAVVSTSIGAEGLEVEQGRHLILADEPADFARQVCRLLADRELRQRLGAQGRDLVVNRYDWAILAKAMDAALCELAGKRP